MNEKTKGHLLSIEYFSNLFARVAKEKGDDTEYWYQVGRRAGASEILRANDIQPIDQLVREGWA